MLAIASGARKARAIVGAARAGLITRLVTDVAAAEAIFELVDVFSIGSKDDPVFFIFSEKFQIGDHPRVSLKIKAAQGIDEFQSLRGMGGDDPVAANRKIVRNRKRRSFRMVGIDR